MTIYIENMYPLGDAAIVVQMGHDIELETHKKVQVLSSYLDKHPIPGMLEHVPAFTSVTIYYDIKKVAMLAGNSKNQEPYEAFFSILSNVIGDIDMTTEFEPEVVEIPVCYGGSFGPDLEYIAKHNGITADEVIAIHSQGQYLTYMVGFAPGFPYLGGLSERIATPRRKTPRLKNPAGTVGIAGMQTGVYPIESPGGWQLIGRTPVRLFRPEKKPPTFIQVGNIVKFKPISREEFDQYKEMRV